MLVVSPRNMNCSETAAKPAFPHPLIGRKHLYEEWKSFYIVFMIPTNKTNHSNVTSSGFHLVVVLLLTYWSYRGMCTSSFCRCICRTCTLTPEGGTVLANDLLIPFYLVSIFHIWRKNLISFLVIHFYKNCMKLSYLSSYDVLWSSCSRKGNCFIFSVLLNKAREKWGTCILY